MSIFSIPSSPINSIVRQDQHHLLYLLMKKSWWCALICSSVKSVSLQIRKVWQSEFKPSLNPLNPLHVVLKVPPYIMRNSPYTKVERLFPITPKRRTHYSIFIICIPVRADNLLLSSFCWVCLCVESCWRFNITRNKF